MAPQILGCHFYYVLNALCGALLAQLVLAEWQD